MELDDRTAAAVAMRLGADHRRAIEESFALSWLDFDVHMALLRACKCVLGRRRFRDFSRELVARSLTNPYLFAKQANYALDLVTGASWPLYRIVPASIRLIFRDAGEFTTGEMSEKSATLRYVNLPREHAQDDTWSIIWLGTLDALADHMLAPRGCRAEIEEVRSDSAAGVFEWRATMHRRSVVGG